MKKFAESVQSSTSKGYTETMKNDKSTSELREFTLFFLQISLGSLAMAAFFGTLVQIIGH